MPELPEVESFRRLLLPLVSKTETLTIELADTKPPRNFVSQEQVLELSNHVQLVDVKRKGKLMCMVLQGVIHNENKKTPNHTLQYFHLYLHMGMTGRIATPAHIPRLESLNNTQEEYPPKHSHIYFKCGSDHEACFSDPRKFGWVALQSSLTKDNCSGFDELAPDALHILTTTGNDDDGDHDGRERALQLLLDQHLPIKALLLDQQRVMSGIGNWIADEVLYQSMVHPEQRYLSEAQGAELLEKLKYILVTAIDCIARGDDFPRDWIFHVRWNKRRTTSGSNNKVKDFKGRMVEFVTSGGRTSAIVPSIQKLVTKSSTAATAIGKAQVQRARKKTNVSAPSHGNERAVDKGENVPLPSVSSSVGGEHQDKQVAKTASIHTNGRKRNATGSGTQPVRRSKRTNLSANHS